LPKCFLSHRNFSLLARVGGVYDEPGRQRCRDTVQDQGTIFFLFLTRAVCSSFSQLQQLTSAELHELHIQLFFYLIK
jgi:hypothetical protein